MVLSKITKEKVEKGYKRRVDNKWHCFDPGQTVAAPENCHLEAEIYNLGINYV